jgi:protein transport protein SEC24
VEALLDSLGRMHAKTEDVESAAGPALDAALKLMGRLGGKLLLFSSGLPSIGDGRLGNRENPRLLNTDKEQTMLLPASDYYKQLAIKLTRYASSHRAVLYLDRMILMQWFGMTANRYQIGVDVFLFSDVYTDVASLNDLAHHTGGQCLYYPAFMALVSANRFKRELTRCLTRLQGWESVIRIRSSKGRLLT